MPDSAAKKWFLWYKLSKYEGFHLGEFATEAEMLSFLSKHSENPDLLFRAVEGREVGYTVNRRAPDLVRA